MLFRACGLCEVVVLVLVFWYFVCYVFSVFFVSEVAMRGRSMPGGHSRKVFKRGAQRVHGKNRVGARVSRGGIRL